MSTAEQPRDETNDPTRWVAALSIAHLFFTLPHALEDFALGEPQARGVPVPAIATVVSFLVAVQALALYWLGQRRARGLWAHAVLGVIWPMAAGFAQLPEIVTGAPYRSGAISVIYVLGIVVVGVALLVSSALALRHRARRARVASSAVASERPRIS